MRNTRGQETRTASFDGKRPLDFAATESRWNRIGENGRAGPLKGLCSSLMSAFGNRVIAELLSEYLLSEELLR